MSLLKPLLTIGLMLSLFTSMSAQVTAISYKIDFNEDTELYDCKMVVTGGNTTALTISRIQANAQYSVVVPTGSVVEMAALHMPLLGNRAYQGTEPMEWDISNVLKSPAAQNQSDYYSIIPRLAPAAHYNDLKEGDEVTLFSLSINSSLACARNIRPHNTAMDPSPAEPGMLGLDFRNGITIGSPIQLYSGNIEPNESMEAAMTDHIVCPGECTELHSTLECMAYPMKYEWVSGETTPSITVCPTENTIYQVTITDGNGSTTVTNTQVTIDTSPESGCITSLANIRNNSIEVYPNPTHSWLAIESVDEVLQVRLYNMDGKALKIEPTADLVLDIEELPSGTYVLEVVTALSSSINKILKL